MPPIPGFIDTLDKVKKIHESKNADYSGERGPFFNFIFCDMVSNMFTNGMDKVFAVFIAVKLARLSVLLSSTKPANNESIDDTFDDLICYATIWKSHYMGRGKAIRQLTEAATIRETK